MTASPTALTKPGVRNPAVLRRLVRDYVSGQWSVLFIAILCMLTVAAANAAIPVLIKLTVKFLFVRKSEEMLWPITIGVVVVMTVRAVAWFGQKSLLDTVGER